MNYCMLERTLEVPFTVLLLWTMRQPASGQPCDERHLNIRNFLEMYDI